MFVRLVSLARDTSSVVADATQAHNLFLQMFQAIPFARQKQHCAMQLAAENGLNWTRGNAILATVVAV